MPDRRPFLSADPTTQDPHVAACAILLELSAADGWTAPSEAWAIGDSLRQDFGLTGAEADRVQATATDRWTSSPELREYVDVIRANWTPAQRQRLVQAMRKVVWADGVLDDNEQRVSWSVAAALGLPFADVRDALMTPP